MGSVAQIGALKIRHTYQTQIIFPKLFFFLSRRGAGAGAGEARLRGEQYLLSIPFSLAAVLLRHFKWRRTKHYPKCQRPTEKNCHRQCSRYDYDQPRELRARRRGQAHQKGGGGRGRARDSARDAGSGRDERDGEGTALANFG